MVFEKKNNNIQKSVYHIILGESFKLRTTTLPIPSQYSAQIISIHMFQHARHCVGSPPQVNSNSQIITVYLVEPTA